MAFRGVCPYIKELGKDRQLACECVSFNFPDIRAKRDVVYGYCAHPEKWKECLFKKAMDNFYERKYNNG